MIAAPVSTELWLRHIRQAQDFHKRTGERHWRVGLCVDGYPFYWTGIATYVAVERGIAHEAVARLNSGRIKGRTVKARLLTDA